MAQPENPNQVPPIHPSLGDEMPWRETELLNLLEVAQAVSSSLDLKEVFKQAAVSLARILRVDFCTISDYDPHLQTVTPLALYPSQGESDSVGEVEYRLADDPAAAQVLETGIPIFAYANDSDTDSSQAALQRRSGVAAVLMLPLRVHGHSFGLIELSTLDPLRRFTTEDLHLAQVLTDQVAIAIENARLYRQLEAREAYFRALTENSVEGVAVLEGNGRFTYISETEEKTLGYPSQETIGQYAFSIVHPDDLQQAEASFQEILRQDGSTALIEYRARHADGTWRSLEVMLKNLLHTPSVNGVVANFRDVTKRKQAEKALEERESHFRTLIENSADAIAILNREGTFQYASASNTAILGCAPEELVGRNVFELLHPDDVAAGLAIFQHSLEQSLNHATGEVRMKHRDGTWRRIEGSISNRLDDPNVRGIVVNYRDVTVRREAEAVMRLQSAALNAAVNAILITDQDGTVQWVNAAYTTLTGYTSAEALGLNPRDLIKSGQQDQAFYQNLWNTILGGRAWQGELINRRKDGSLYHEEMTITPLTNAQQEIHHFIAIKQDITARRKMEASLQESEIHARSLLALSRKLEQAQTYEEALDAALDEIKAVLGYRSAWVYLLSEDRETAQLFSVRGVRVSFVHEDFPTLTIRGDPYLEETARAMDVVLIEDARTDPRTNKDMVALFDNRTIVNVPMVLVDQHFGTLGTGSFGEEGVKIPTAVQQKYLFAMGGHMAVTYNRLQLMAERQQVVETLRRRANELEALSHVAASLRQVTTQEELLPRLLEETLALFHAETGAILLLDREYMFVAAAHGPEVAMLGKAYLADEGLIWQVAHTGEMAFIRDRTAANEHRLTDFCLILMGEMAACVCVPLKTAEATVGVLHLASRAPRTPTPEEISLLTAIAEMGGAAIHRAALHEKTLNHAMELEAAYEATLEGWARALELRDEITEGHTRRVTELTLRLARVLHIPENELIHIRRGALLHDIGKMGIPDRVLLKTGPLTTDETAIMRNHPVYAYGMLIPIPFLRPALDIPYCHHEKWDGSGYPRGLKKEKIPLAARIFSVIDVWDALTSDRPYRQAWAKAKAREYIRERAGQDFDPQVVRAFLSMTVPYESS